MAIDRTENDPFTGYHDGDEYEIIGTKEDLDEYAYQWATIQIVGDHPPIVLDALPVVKGEEPTEYGPKLLNSAQDLVDIDLVLMVREFDSQHVLKAVVKHELDYVVPKRRQTSEKAKAKQIKRFSMNSLAASWHERVVRRPLGHRERIQERETIHGRNYVE